MAWEVGKQTRKKRFSNVNKRILEEKGYIDEKKAKILLYEFLYDNPTYASRLLLGVKIFPFQHIAIKSMLEADFSLNVWSRGLSKSFTTALFLMLHATFNQGIKCAILSKTFRQSKMVFKKMEEILSDKKAGLVNQVVNITHGSDEWLMTIGTSEIRALPLGDGDKLRGFRFNCVVIDEFLLMPERIYNEVIKPFLSNNKSPTDRAEIREIEDKLIAEGKMKEEDRTKWESNKLIMLSSASFKFEFLYKVYETYERLILGTFDKEKDKDEILDAKRIVTHFAYDVAPKDLYDENLIKESKETMSEQQFKREFGSQFLDDSSGYFRTSKMVACQIPEGEKPCTEIKGKKEDNYIVSIDPSWAESESSDDFALKVFKLLDNGRAVCVHSYAVHGANLKKHIEYLYYILKNFNVVSMVCDYMGGVVFISACNESTLFKQAGIKIEVIDVELEGEPQEYTKALQEYKNTYNKEQGRICIMRKPTSQWIRRANEMLQASFDHKRILFAASPIDDDYLEQKDQVIPELTCLTLDSEYKEDKDDLSSKTIDLIDRIGVNLKATIVQCSQIEPTTNASGGQSFDLQSSVKKMTGKNKLRKDSYSALVLGNWMVKVWNDQLNLQVEDNSYIPYSFG